jgi:hypothetical protein
VTDVLQREGAIPEGQIGKQFLSQLWKAASFATVPTIASRRRIVEVCLEVQRRSTVTTSPRFTRRSKTTAT